MTAIVLMLPILVVAELLERYLFFAAAVSPKNAGRFVMSTVNENLELRESGTSSCGSAANCFANGFRSALISNTKHDLATSVWSTD